MVKVKL